MPPPDNTHQPQTDATSEPPPTCETPPGRFWKPAYRVCVFVIGMSVLLIGVAMIVLPGPAIVVIPLGLAILATEFLWARILLKSIKDRIKSKPPE